MDENQYEMAERLQRAQIAAGVESIQRYSGISRDDCIECGEDIPTARQIAVPGVQCCRDCQELIDFNAKGARRG